ncbi:MAG: alpha/beta hydrolase family protein [Pseudotabrizicola sp.]|uniref:alpha/beta hydrolase n=1 Tax=Pseudotabrizicola sp. TaxID=2939647 RepID=UPI002730521B|nr:alpha/beta hydrolase family protein [Pseudotabrizicola sp.]MDP2081602.1 alpha/beta hydrolase family protein [Pseudotabrizicola sp.]MDZ7576419.1 alpha/beta hydrolase family protein [Pseudotabrizicola sp.]
MTRLKTATLIAALAVPATAMADTFVLVHGAFQTGAVWDGTVAALEAAGHSAIAVDLPGRPGDGRIPGEVTMSDHVANVISVIEAAGPDPVVLVGHSFGGMTISAVAEAAPDRIATLVYVAAYLPAVDQNPGESMQDLALSDRHGGWQADSFVVAPDYATASVNPRDRAALFANDADTDLAAAIAAAMVDEPLAPIATPVALTLARFGQVRAAYVVTLRDRAVSTDLQLTMLGRGSVAEAVPMDTGHAPHQVDPQAMAAALIRAATPEVE